MLYYPLLFVFYLLFAFLTYRQVRFGIYLILLFLPSYQIRYQIFGLPATLLEGMIWLLFIIWLIKSKFKTCPEQKRGIENLIPQVFRLPIILLLAAATISAFTLPNLQTALGIWKAYFIEALLFFIVFVYNIKTCEHVKHAIRILGVLTIIIGLFAIYQKLTGAFIPNPFWAEEATRRITTFFGYPNANALLLVPIIFLTLGNFISNFQTTDKIPYSLFLIPYSSIISMRLWLCRWFDIIVIISGGLTILWTKSAGALLALAVGLICLLIFYKKTRLATLLIIAITSLTLLFTPTIKNKIQHAFVSTNEIHLSAKPTDLQIRVQQWRETLNLLNNRPIFGAGLAGYQTLILPYHVNKHIEIFLYPHNFFLNFWTETGLLGLISIIWILAVFFYMGYRLLIIDNANRQILDTGYVIHDTRKTLTLCVICAMIALLIQGLVDAPYFKNDLSILFWIIIGMMITLHQDTSNKLQETKNNQ